MDARKIAIIIHKTEEELCARLIDSLQNIEVPEDYDVEVLPVEGDEKFFVYDFAMNHSDAKYKIYVDEKILVFDKNILSKLLEIFQSDEKIGIIGVSGAIKISTHGTCIESEQRCGKIFLTQKKILFEWENIDGDFQAVDAVDGWFMATQYDLTWRHDIFHGDTFGDTVQCIEFMRQKNYKSVVIQQETPAIWYTGQSWGKDEISRNIFLDEYSKINFPLVSVIIPTFNRPKYFELALGSALAQTYRNIEIVVSDNSTENDTEILIQKYLAKFSNVKYFRHKNFSADDNWNFCRHYNNPDAEFVNWLMDDDLFFPEKIEHMVEVCINNPGVSLVTSYRDFIDKDNKIRQVHSKFFNDTGLMEGKKAGRLLVIFDNYIGEPTTVLIRKKFLRDNDMCWFEDEQGFYPLVDVSTWLQLLTKGDLFYINESLSAFRNHDNQQTLFKGTGLRMMMCWTKLLKAALEQKFFLQDERDIRLAFTHWFRNIALKFRDVQAEGYTGPEVSIAEEFYIAMAKAFRNDYKIEYPPIKFCGADKFIKIFEKR